MQQPEQIEHEAASNDNQKRSGWRKVKRWGQRIVLGVLGGMLLFFLAFQIPFVQNYVVDGLTGYLSSRTGSRVEIGYFRLGFFNQLVLKDVYVEDLDGDTLLFSSGLNARLDLSPITLLRQGLVIDGIQLNDARLFIRRKSDSFVTNLNLFLEKLKNKEKENRANRPFSIKLTRVDLGTFTMLKVDSLKGQVFELGLQNAAVRVNDIDLPSQQFDLESVRITKPRIFIEDRERTALWDSFLVLPFVKDTSLLQLSIGNIVFEDGTFVLHNYRKDPIKTTPDSIMDYKHLDVRRIELDIQRFLLEQDTFTGQLNCLSMEESSGFVLNELSAGDARVSPKGVFLNGMRMLTPESDLGDTLILRFDQYLDFFDFPNAVIIDARLKNSRVSLGDVIAFAPKLHENKFFARNQHTSVSIRGNIYGTINTLEGKDLRFNLEDGSVFDGNFDSRNLTEGGQSRLNINLNNLRAYVQTLRDLLPNFDLPSNFDRLGFLRFRGDVDLIFSDFIAKGDLVTDIGDAQLDIKLVGLNGNQDETGFSGAINLLDFDLGIWTNDPDFGKITIYSSVENGLGLGRSATADLSANMESFTFKNYSYENATFTGSLNARKFDGQFNIKDDNIDFRFSGALDLAGKTPIYNFDASINRLDLQKLNLTEKELVLSGRVNLDLRNRTLDDLEGTAEVNNVRILLENKELSIDRAAVQSNLLDTTGNKELIITSDILEGKVTGLFNVDKVPLIIGQYFEEHFPDFSNRFGITMRDTLFYPQNFDFELSIKDTKGFQELVQAKLEDIQGATIVGTFNNLDSLFTSRIKFPLLAFGKSRIEGLDIKLDIEGSTGQLELEAPGLSTDGGAAFSSFIGLTNFDRDTLGFGLIFRNPKEKPWLKSFDFDGKLFVEDSSTLILEMANSSLEVLNELWNINANNRIVFKEDSIRIRDFTAVQPNRMASLESFGKRGIVFSAVNLNFNGLDSLLLYEPIDFDGIFNATAQTDDITKLSNIQFAVTTDSLILNQDDWGVLRIDGTMKSPQQPLYTYLSITKDSAHQLIAEGTYNLQEIGLKPEEAANYFNANVQISSFPLKLAEYFIGGTISGTTGSIDAGLYFFGKPDDPKVKGQIQIGPGGININYLNTQYTFDGATIEVDEYAFDASGTILKDKFNNTATVVGGIRHNHLKNFGFNARLYTADRFLGLDTKKGDNSLFYGQGIGRGEVLFTGSFRQPDLYVNAEVGEGTRIVIPVTYERQASELSFIRFVDWDEEKTSAGEQVAGLQPYDLKGVSLEMDLTATPAAVMQIIFDEQAGDIIEGSGTGNLRISVPRSGDFKMYGDFNIEQGDYLFTLYNVINKKFSVQKGGSISWNGDPFGANIDIVARYSDLNPPLANFIQEYLVNASNDIKNQASNSTDVVLKLQLTGELMKPTINFDIQFPQLKGELETYANSKLRLLRQDQNEMNKQVFGLIVAGQFLPTDFNLQGTEIIYNTVSEFVSNQLSLLITELFAEIIGEGKTLSSVDFDIAYSQYQNVDLGEGQNFNRGNELQVSLKQNFFNDRLSILVGGNIDLDGSTQATAQTSGAFVGNDLIIEYLINKERTVKFRIYQKLEPDIGGRKLQFGTGLSYRREFNSFSDFLKSFKKDK